jgi:hypothetical protein
MFIVSGYERRPTVFEKLVATIQKRAGIIPEFVAPAFFKLACEAYLENTHPLLTIPFFEITMGAHHRPQVENWLAQDSINRTEVQDYWDTHIINPDGMFAQTFGIILAKMDHPGADYDSDSVSTISSV